MAEVLEAMGFPSEWCETALESSSGLETAVDLLLQWQVNGLPQQFAPLAPTSAPASAPESSARGEEPVVQHEQTNSGSMAAGKAPTLKLGPLPGAGGSASKPPANDTSVQSPSSTILPPSSGLSSLEGSPRVNHPSPGESSCSDAVVPDPLAEQRKTRYLAARREKQEMEATRERIRQQMREDMDTRRARLHYESPSTADKGKAVMTASEGEVGGVEKRPGQASMDAFVELHIRCPWNQNLKRSFRASDTLKDVRAYVEQQAELRTHWGNSEEQRQRYFLGENLRIRPGSVPFSGWSASVADSTSSDRGEEKEILKAARENHETRTRQILASAKSLRDDPSGTSQSRNDPPQARIYFLIPFPKKAFLSESAMETTLAEAQLVPTGTLIVQHGATEPGQQVGGVRKGENYDISGGRRGRHVRTVVEEASPPVYAAPEDFGPSDGGYRPIVNAARESDRVLETEGERVRIRERALQAAAKRMSEAAKIFHAGLPLEEGETGQAFHFPKDEDNEDVEENGRRPDAPSITSSIGRPELQGAAPVREPTGRSRYDVVKAGADADATLSIAHNSPAEPLTNAANRTLDAPHLMAVAAAEQRLRNPQPLRAVEECNPGHESSEQEARSQEESSRFQPRSRGRMAGAPDLRPRPEKQQRTSNRSLPGAVVIRGRQLSGTFQQSHGGNSSRRQSPSPTDAERRAESLKAAMQRCMDANEAANKGKEPEVEAVPMQEAPSSSSPVVQQETTSTLRVRLEDGGVVSRTYPACTQLQLVRNSLTPDEAVFSDYGFVIPFPEPRFMEGEDLNVTLEDVGLVPRGTIHLMKVASRGIVREGRMPSRRRHLPDYDEYFRDDDFFERLLDENFSYEDMLGLEESIGRVHVGVPEEMVTLFPTRIVEEKLETSGTNEGVEGESNVSLEQAKGEFDLCTVCMAEMVPKEEVLSLPCLHTYHSLCIKKWLRQSTHCPTCKRSVV